MKTLIQIVAILSLAASATVFADTPVCRDDADTIGYVGPADLLPACEPFKNNVADEAQVTERIVTKSDRKEEAKAVAQAKREQARQQQ